jgi:hypothetical protein
VIEHVVPLDPDRRQVRDDEETSVVDVVSRNRCPSRPPVLNVNELCQTVATCLAVKELKLIIYRLGDVGPGLIGGP